MKRNVRKVVSYSKSYKSLVVNSIMREGISITSACMQYWDRRSIDEVYQVNVICEF